ncbi:MAG TPA: undecaprenyl-diphosphate phosphatase [Bacteroidia bacterium]|nr:undecaprenyl-diphosphate phosphatase [Bacteroidia bacterium]
MTFLQSIILSIIEGLTEFLPVSSTGHMILGSAIMKMQETEFAKTFEIVIQLGAIMAVFALYWKRFFVSLDIYLKLAIAFIPTGILGFIAYKTIKHYLFNPITVSTSLIIGGVVLILLDKWTEKKESKYKSIEEVSFKDAAMIGLFQCISMIPGVSRAAATIFGGIYSGFNRKQAAEFSFLLAIPTMLAASGYDLWKNHDNIHKDDLSMILVGAAVAFVVALFAVKAFVTFLTKRGFKFFGYYRIALGIIFLLYAYYAGLQLAAQ